MTTLPPEEPTFTSVIDLGEGRQMVAKLDKPRDAHTPDEWAAVVAGCRAAWDEMAKVQAEHPPQPVTELHPDIKAFMERQNSGEGT